MKRIFILRHGKAVYMEPHLDDFDRPLTVGGKQAIGFLLDQVKAWVDLPEIVLCSTARRTRETLEALAPCLPPSCQVVFDGDLYLASKAQLVGKIHQVQDTCHGLLLVGHNPGLDQLVNWLLGEEGNFPLIQSLPTGGLAKIAFNVPSWSLVEQGSGNLESYLLPEEF